MNPKHPLLRTAPLALAFALLQPWGQLIAQVFAPAPSRVPATGKHIYFAQANPKADIAAAIERAGREHKRIILDFGGDWCGDCQVLDMYLHQTPNAQILAQNFILVRIEIGHMDHNVDIAQRYKVPIAKGVPALAVLDSHGKLLFSQANKEFGHIGTMEPHSVTEFLLRWKA